MVYRRLYCYEMIKLVLLTVDGFSCSRIVLGQRVEGREGTGRLLSVFCCPLTGEFVYSNSRVFV